MEKIKIKQLSEEDKKFFDKAAKQGDSLDAADRWIRNPNDSLEF